MSSPAASAHAAVESLYLGSEGRFWFVSLHRASPAADTGIGLVIVPPFGFEAVCAHRALRHMAEDAAIAGVSAVRIDLDGTGDSSGDDLEPERLAHWIASIDAAADFLRANGATRVVLAGVRLGALLAILCATGRRDVAGVVAIAPVVSGRRWLREMRVLQLALDLAPTPSERVLVDEVQEVIGFALTAQTRDAVTRIDLEKLAQLPAPSVLIIDRHDLPAATRWAAHLRELGVTVEYEKLPGYTEMMLDPHRTEVPVEIINATIAFAAMRPALDVVHSAPDSAAYSRVQMGSVLEQVVVMNNDLRAIVTQPAEARPRSALVFLNAGGVRRIGPNRLHVPLARRIADEFAMMVLRVDLSGLGDSPSRDGTPENMVYHEHAIDDIQTIVAWIHQQGIADVYLAGLCSGGYYALEAAHVGRPLRGVIVINPGAPGVPDDLSPYQAVADAARYRKMMRSPRGWSQVFAKMVDPNALRRLITTVIKRTCSSASVIVGSVLRRVGVSLKSDSGTRLAALCGRGVAITFVFCADEPGLVVLRERAGSVLLKMQRDDAISLRVLDGIDHTFTPLWSHPVLTAELLTALRRTCV
ncbi:MAG TPA: alpha/beta hydrolase [Rhodanobacter sp.]|nr:alpha/beta hydrolase [Rhodanobacter sp.]